MDKRKVKQYEATLTDQRDALLGMVERTEDYGREADREVSQDPADKASNSYTKVHKLRPGDSTQTTRCHTVDASLH